MGPIIVCGYNLWQVWT